MRCHLVPPSVLRGAGGFAVTIGIVGIWDKPRPDMRFSLAAHRVNTEALNLQTRPCRSDAIHFAHEARSLPLQPGSSRPYLAWVTFAGALDATLWWSAR